MYPLGCLFGLGFDTASEVASSCVAGGAAASGLPFYAILCLPVLFAAGMTLFDTIDGAFMNFAYGWAFSQPIRKVFYSLTVTGLSRLGRAADRHDRAGLGARGPAHLTGAAVGFVCEIDMNMVGYAIVALFVLTWVGASPSGASGGSRKAGPAGILGRPSDRAGGLSPFRRRRSGGRPGGSAERPPGERPPGHRGPAPRARGALRCRGPGFRRVPGGGRGGANTPMDAASVHRNLSQLEELGLVRHVHIGHGPGLYGLVGRGRSGVPRLRALRTGDDCRARKTRFDPALDPAPLRLRGALHPLPDPRALRELPRRFSRREVPSGRRQERTSARTRAQSRRPRAFASPRARQGAARATSTDMRQETADGVCGSSRREVPRPWTLLGIYLNDHLAGSVVGENLAKRIARQNEDNDYGRAVRADRQGDRGGQGDLRRALEAASMAVPTSAVSTSGRSPPARRTSATGWRTSASGPPARPSAASQPPSSDPSGRRQRDGKSSRGDWHGVRRRSRRSPRPPSRQLPARATREQ